MQFSDFISLTQWWGVMFMFGIFFFPLSSFLFSSFFDFGYLFSKVIGIVIISYLVFLFGVLHIIPFTFPGVLGLSFIAIFFQIIILKKYIKTSLLKIVKKSWIIFLIQEIIFFIALMSWTVIRGYQPDINGLEKYMDFGFINSILRSTYFPPKDMWFTPFSINYYYFGHLFTAVITRLSGVDQAITFNYMVATIFAFTFCLSFSLGANIVHLFSLLKEKGGTIKKQTFLPSNAVIAIGLVSAFLVTSAGNLHIIYAFFKPYPNESPVPFWNLELALRSFPNSYWYPNATRFIYHTIHEFPLYSFVVSDLHGHVLDIPFVLLTIAILFSYFGVSILRENNSKNPQRQHAEYKISAFGSYVFPKQIFFLILMGFLLACMYMTNAWDGLIYFLLTAMVLSYVQYKKRVVITTSFSSLFQKSILVPLFKNLCIILIAYAIFSFPFNYFFKPFVSGFGILCAPQFLTNIGHIGPLLFEPSHCQKSPLWQLAILYGFFYFWGISLLIFLWKKRKIEPADVFIFILFIFSTILIIIPEFVYAKDIYPEHYRANTMFKLVYQSFIMLSLVSGYSIFRIIKIIRYSIKKPFVILYCVFAIILFSLVSIYPYFAITSYYGTLQKFNGLYGTTYLKNLYPDDFSTIQWINMHITGQPVILEAQGDSYTNYARISSNTGLPTVLGWTVHEWLWRGTYDVPAPRIADVQTLYTSSDITLTKQLLKKYHVSYVYISVLEYQKYPMLNAQKFNSLGKVVYHINQTKLYKLY